MVDGKWSLSLWLPFSTLCASKSNQKNMTRFPKRINYMHSHFCISSKKLSLPSLFTVLQNYKVAKADVNSALLQQRLSRHFLRLGEPAVSGVPATPKKEDFFAEARSKQRGGQSPAIWSLPISPKMITTFIWSSEKSPFEDVDLPKCHKSCL